MANKVFKTVDEQLEIMRYRGLIIDDEISAKDILLRENYFFLSGYRHLFMQNGKDQRYIEGTMFRELYSLFRFDRNFRNIMFKNLLIVENNIKSIFSYQLSKKYGYREKDYLKPENFTSDYKKSRQVNDLIKKMKRQIHVNGNLHTATMHYISRYGYIPLWILVKVLSFGIVSEFYSILKHEDKQAIADHYRLAPGVLETYLPLLANYRNLCAHEDILFEHRTERVISDTKYHQYLNIPRDEESYIYGKNDLFAIIIIMKQMLTVEEFRLFMNEIGYELDLLAGRLETVPIERVLNRMGFPVNYREIIEME